MRTVGAFEAKTHLSALLERVDAAIPRLKELRAGSSLGGLSWRELRDLGRR